MVKKEFILISEIIKNSISKDWENAKKEWKVIETYYDENYDSCSCSHYPIKEIIIIENINNGLTMKIGNCCINKFFEIKKYNKLFIALSKKKINSSIIKISHEKKIINYWESKFLNDVFRKRKLSEKQSDLKNNLIEKIFRELIKNGR